MGFDLRLYEQRKRGRVRARDGSIELEDGHVLRKSGEGGELIAVGAEPDAEFAAVHLALQSGHYKTGAV
jgi:hypothetical protein